jgi:hypothetical protein
MSSGDETSAHFPLSSLAISVSLSGVFERIYIGLFALDLAGCQSEQILPGEACTSHAISITTSTQRISKFTRRLHDVGMNGQESEIGNARLGQRLAAATGLEAPMAALVAGLPFLRSEVHP